jgi:hypothetical protein
MPFISYILRYIAKEIVRYAFKGFIRNIGGRGIYKLFKDLFGGKSIKDIFKQYVRT